MSVLSVQTEQQFDTSVRGFASSPPKFTTDSALRQISPQNLKYFETINHVQSSPPQSKASKVYLEAIRSLQSKVKTLQQENTLLKSNNQSLTDQLQELTDKINQQEQSFIVLEENLKLKLKQLQDEVLQYKKKKEYEQLQSERNHISNDMVNLQKEFQKKTVQVESLERLLTKYKKQNQLVHEQLEQSKQISVQRFYARMPSARLDHLSRQGSRQPSPIITKSAIKEKYMNVVQKLAAIRAEIGQLNEDYAMNVKVQDIQTLIQLELLIVKKEEELENLTKEEEALMMLI